MTVTVIQGGNRVQSKKATPTLIGMAFLTERCEMENADELRALPHLPSP